MQLQFTHDLKDRGTDAPALSEAFWLFSNAPEKIDAYDGNLFIFENTSAIQFVISLRPSVLYIFQYESIMTED